MRWSSLFTVVGGILVAVAGLIGLLTGHPWSAVPLALGAAIALREVRFLKRVRSGKIQER